jgi:hypothetical protein
MTQIKISAQENLFTILSYRFQKFIQKSILSIYHCNHNRITFDGLSEILILHEYLHYNYS